MARAKKGIPALGDKIDDIRVDRESGYFYIGFSSFKRLEQFLKWALNKSDS